MVDGSVAIVAAHLSEHTALVVEEIVSDRESDGDGTLSQTGFQRILAVHGDVGVSCACSVEQFLHRSVAA